MAKKICVCTLGAIALIMTCINFNFESTQAALSSEFLRLHIIAHSDSPEDQKLKLMVRDRILSESGDLFEPGCDISKARDEVRKSLGKIEDTAKKVISENGYDYPVRASLGKSTFPTKEYGNLVLPTGTYEALKIEIGESKGKNWWCVLFPPLCFVDESCVSANAEEVRSLEKNIGKSNISLISKDKSNGTKIKFKTYEIWQKGKQKLTAFLGGDI